MSTDTSTTTGSGAPGAQPARTNIVKVVFASLIGTAVEWYDFFLYGSAATPMEAYVGRRPIAKVATPMRNSEKTSIFLRPTLSPK